MENYFFELFEHILMEEDGGDAGGEAGNSTGTAFGANAYGGGYAEGDARNLFGTVKGEGGSKWHPNTKKYAKNKSKRRKRGKKDMSGKPKVLFTQTRMFPTGY